MKFLIGIIALAAVGLGVAFWIDSQSAASKSAKGKDLISLLDPEDFQPEPEFNVNELAEEQEKQSQFGSDRVKEGKDAKPVAFDGKRAMKYLDSICDLGPRISGTASMRKQQELIKKHFEELGAKVEFQTFTATQNSVRGKVEMTNIIISFQPEKKRRVILCSHYDTRPIADREPDPRDWKKRFVSANDGGSGVALLMEMAHHMKDLKTNVGVDFVIFDGEEYIYKAEGDNRDRYFIGSEHFAKTWRAAKGRCDYSAAILLDMIAGQKIHFPVEVNSFRRYPELCKEIWAIAQGQNAKAFLWQRGHEVLDDHIELQKVGIPAIDLIDFDYPHWHRLSDTPTNCSGESMEQVARVLSVWLQRTK
jgi:glutaminyl-peptide cyclotransferase